MNFKILSLFIFSFLLISYSLKAQDVEENMRMVKPFKADGVTNEWNEPLNQYNDATKLAFALANDDKNLYIVIESLDPQTTFSILRGGITLNINIQGKKKDGIKLTFPLMERLLMPKDGGIPIVGNNDLPPREQDERGHDQSAMNKSIKVLGFKNIKDGDLPFVNETGIKTGMSIHPNRDLIYELSIPLSQLEVGLDLKMPIVYNIKINQPNKPDFKTENNHKDGERINGRGGMGGGTHGGMGGGEKMGGRGGSGQKPSGEGNRGSESQKSDFWIKYKLAKF